MRVIVDWALGLLKGSPPVIKTASVVRRQDGSVMAEVREGAETRHYVRQRAGTIWYRYPDMDRTTVWTQDWLDTVERYCNEHGGRWPDAHKNKG